MAKDRVRSKPGSSYFYGIDLVRLASALSVAAFHLSWKTPEIEWLMPFGWVGVEVFFVISGLVIANSANGASAREFAVGRFLRLYPVAWCVAPISFVLVVASSITPVESLGSAAGLTLKPFVLSLLLVNGPFLATAYWTLPIELSFYFLVLVVIGFSGFKHARWLAVFLILWGLPYLIALAFNTSGMIHWSWLDFGYGWKNKSLLRYGPYFGLGIFIWLFKENRLRKSDLLFVGLAVILGFLEIYARAANLQPGFTQSVLANKSNPLHLTIAACLAFSVALIAILASVKFNHLFPASATIRKVVRQLGLTTYPLYLLHESLGDFIRDRLNGIGLARLPSVLVALCVVGIVSLSIATYFEPALRNLLKGTVWRLASFSKRTDHP